MDDQTPPPGTAGPGSPAAPGLSVVVGQDAAEPVVTVAGELDLAGAGLVTAMVDHVHRRRDRAHRTGERVDVDLAGVTSADAQGLAAVVDGGTRIVASSEPVRRVLRLLDGPRRDVQRTPDGWAASA